MPSGNCSRPSGERHSDGATPICAMPEPMKWTRPLLDELVPAVGTASARRGALRSTVVRRSVPLDVSLTSSWNRGEIIAVATSGNSHVRCVPGQIAASVIVTVRAASDAAAPAHVHAPRSLRIGARASVAAASSVARARTAAAASSVSG